MSEDDRGRYAHLDETFSPVIVIVEFVPELFKDGYEAPAGSEVDSGSVGHGRVRSSYAVLQIIKTMVDTRSCNAETVPVPRTLWRPVNAQEQVTQVLGLDKSSSASFTTLALSAFLLVAV